MKPLSTEDKLERIRQIWQEWYDSDDCSGVEPMAEISGLLDVNTDDAALAASGSAGD